jgi:hypothetical protein
VRTGVPDLRLYPLIIYREYAGGELDTDRRPALEIELVAYEPREHCVDKVSALLLFGPHPQARLHTYSFYVVRKARTKRVSGRLTGNEERREKLTTFLRPSRQLGESSVAG